MSVARTNEPPGFAVIDVETTGLSSRSDRILQLAVVLLDSRCRPTAEWSTFVRPPRVLRADLGPTHIHGIRRRQLVLAPREVTALGEFAALTASRIVVAHNARFDAAFLHRAADRLGIALDWSGLVCTLELSRRLDPGRQLLHRLPDVCERYGVSIGRAHHALNDAVATSRVLPGLLRDNGIDPTFDAQPAFMAHPSHRD